LSEFLCTADLNHSVSVAPWLRVCKGSTRHLQSEDAIFRTSKVTGRWPPAWNTENAPTTATIDHLVRSFLSNAFNCHSYFFTSGAECR
jgi:hypothetical protein